MVLFIVIGGIAYALTEQGPDDNVLYIVTATTMDLACLGMGLAAGAILSRFRRRPLSILAALSGVLYLAFFVMLMFLGS